MMAALAALSGFVADCFFGDPVYPFHPVRVMGRVISAGDRLLRRGGKAADFIGGALLSLALVAASWAIPFCLLRVLYGLHWAAGLAVEAAFCYQIFAARALKDESMKVYHRLAAGDTPGARRCLSYIVGRDTDSLGDEAIAKAAVETVAENLSDGVIAPMIYTLIGGAQLGFAYKAVNTLDSMIGYNNDKYAYFGKFAARMDDAANFVPARVSALLMIAAAFFCRMDGRRAWRVFLRDRYKHNSPNSAQTEAACAGALGLSLSGDSYYKGALVRKPVIGDAVRPAEKDDIARANVLMYAASWLGLIIGVAVRAAICHV